MNTAAPPAMLAASRPMGPSFRPSAPAAIAPATAPVTPSTRQPNGSGWTRTIRLAAQPPASAISRALKTPTSSPVQLALSVSMAM